MDAQRALVASLSDDAATAWASVPEVTQAKLLELGLTGAELEQLMRMGLGAAGAMVSPTGARARGRFP